MDKVFPRLAKFTAVFQALNIQIIKDLFSKVAKSESTKQNKTNKIVLVLVTNQKLGLILNEYQTSKKER